MPTAPETGPLQKVPPEWVERALAEKIPTGAAMLAARNWGVSSKRRADLAAEATAEAFARTLARRYTNEVHYRRSLVVVARNCLVDLLRRERRGHPLPEDAQAHTEPDGAPGVALERCLAELPVADAELIWMTYERGRTLDQIAADLLPNGGSANARRLRVRNRRLAIERQLADCLRRHGVAEESTTQDS